MFIDGKYVPFSLLMSVEPEGEPAGGHTAQIASLESRLAAAQGSAAVVAQQLYNELFSVRSELGKKEGEIGTLKVSLAEASKKIPAEGSRMLTKEESTIYDALLALGKPDEIKAKLEKVPELEKKVTDSERATLVDKVAAIAGFNTKVFATLVDGLQFEIKSEAGKDVAFVKSNIEGKETLTPVADYANANFVEFLPSLKPADTRRHAKQDVSSNVTGEGAVFDRIRQRVKDRQEAQKSESKPLSERLNLVRSA